MKNARSTFVIWSIALIAISAIPIWVYFENAAASRQMESQLKATQAAEDAAEQANQSYKKFRDEMRQSTADAERQMEAIRKR